MIQAGAKRERRINMRVSDEQERILRTAADLSGETSLRQTFGCQEFAHPALGLDLVLEGCWHDRHCAPVAVLDQGMWRH
jgi:hypothetical protein